MIVLKVDLTGFRDALGRAHIANRALVAEQSRAAELAAALCLKSLKRHCPVGLHWTPDGRPFRTFELRNSLHISGRRMKPVKSIHARSRWWGQEIDISMLARGVFTLEGAKAREIWPHKRALHFFWDGRKYPPRIGMPPSAIARLRRTIRNLSDMGGEVWLAHVNWPGYPGRRWDVEAYLEVKDRVHELLRRVAMTYAIRLKGG